jgi:hypothetical protein
VLLALGAAVTGAVVDMGTSHALGPIFQGGYLLGCVAAVCRVRRRNLFGPMVQPPLILLVVTASVVLLASGKPPGARWQSDVAGVRRGYAVDHHQLRRQECVKNGRHRLRCVRPPVGCWPYRT